METNPDNNFDHICTAVDYFQPALTLDKTATTGGYTQAGNPVGYNYLLTNSGNVNLYPPYVVDDDKATVTCPSTPNPLVPAGTLTCTATYNVTQADVDAGSVTNIATAKAQDQASGGNQIESNQDQVTVNGPVAAPKIQLLKTGTLNDNDGTPGVSAGDSISYVFAVSNTGNVTLTNVTLADTVGGVTINGGPTIASLLPGAVDSTTFTGSYTLTQADVDAGTFTNTATATGTPPSGGNVSDPDSDTKSLARTPALSLDKSTASGFTQAGDVLTYSYLLTNIGNVTLTPTFAVVDDKATVTCPQPGSLAPGASITCSASYTVTQADVNLGSVTNTATASAQSPTGSVTSNQDQVTVTGSITAPSIVLAKTGTLNDDDGTAGVSAGDTISYAFTVTNNGGVTLTNVTLSDPLITVSGGPIASMAPSAVDSTTFTGSYTLTQADIDAGTLHQHGHRHR